MAAFSRRAPAIIAALSALVLCGCASAPGDTFIPLPARRGFARLYIYRAEEVRRFTPASRIMIDGHLVGSLRKGSYLAFYLPAGAHVVVAEAGPVNEPGGYKMIDAPVDRDCFIRFSVVEVARFPNGDAEEQTNWITQLDTPDAPRSLTLIRHLALLNSNFDALAPGGQALRN